MQALRAMEMVCDVSNHRINDKNRVAAKTTCTQLLSCMCE